MTAAEMFRAGDLTGALAAQQAVVKSQPADLGARTFLFELLAFAGELERADKQLDVVAKQDPQRDAAVQVYRNLVHAEGLRRRTFSEGLAPRFFADPPADVRRHLDAVQRLREGRSTEAAEILAEAADLRTEPSGELDGAAFDAFRDADDVLAPVLELHVGRDYHWVPWAQIGSLEVLAPTVPRDLLWPACEVHLRDGSRRRGYAPALYPGSHAWGDDRVRLGLATDWQETEGGPVRGVGRKLLLAGDRDVGLSDVRQLQFDAADDKSAA